MSIWEMSISASVMILLILVFRKLGSKKVPKGAVMALWNLVLLRALIPGSIPIGNLPVFQAREQKRFGEILGAWEKVRRSQVISIETIQQVQQGNEKLQLMDYLPWIWAAGAICLLLYFLHVYRKEQKVLKDSVPVHNEAAERVVHHYALRRKIRLYEGETFETPVTYGIFFPKIVLPSEFEIASRLDMRNMIAHELEHIRKFDVGKRYLMALALCVHWFNPLMWLMYRIYQVDQEMACDERVMRNMKKGEAKNYICTMIKMATEEKSLFATTTGFGGRNAAKKRILQALYGKKREIGGAAAALLFGGCLLLEFVSFSQTEINISPLLEGRNLVEVEKKITEVEKEQMPELIEPRFDRTSYLPVYDESFDYDGTIKDIIDNYNDPTQPLTKDQEMALTIQNGIYMAELYKELQENGRKLNSDEIWVLEEFYGAQKD